MKTVEQLYKSTEVSTEVLAGLLSAISTHGVKDAEALKHSCQFLTCLAKAENFDMTMMFMEDKEQKMLAAIMTEANKKLKGANS